MGLATSDKMPLFYNSMHDLTDVISVPSKSTGTKNTNHLSMQEEVPASSVPQLEKKVLTLRDHLEQDLGEKDALLKLLISGIQNLNESLDGEI